MRVNPQSFIAYSPAGEHVGLLSLVRGLSEPGQIGEWTVVLEDQTSRGRPFQRVDFQVHITASLTVLGRCINLPSRGHFECSLSIRFGFIWVREKSPVDGDADFSSRLNTIPKNGGVGVAPV